MKLNNILKDAATILQDNLLPGKQPLRCSFTVTEFYIFTGINV
jgi:hypothetical protein